MHISIIGGYCGGLKVFHLWLFLPCTIFLYDTRYLLHLLVLEHPDVNRLLSDLGFYVAKPFRHCYLVHNCKGIKKRTLIFKVNNAFPLKIERFSQFFHGKTFWIFPRFCWPQSAQHQHTVTFSLKKSTWQFSVQLQNAILAFLLGKFVKKPFQKCGENLLKRLFTFLLCNNKSA